MKMTEIKKIVTEEEIRNYNNHQIAHMIGLNKKPIGTLVKTASGVYGTIAGWNSESDRFTIILILPGGKIKNATVKDAIRNSTIIKKA